MYQRVSDDSPLESPFLHEKLKSTLKERGLSQYALAKSIGISQPYMNQLTNGDRVPSIALVRSICRELKMELSDLILDPGADQ